ncbi:MBL fold metallo-hydrolase [Nonomuraea dietziae]|uniref:MBL fold metallo-hydrolase n=1 Tax=Nonomuraea dietziae TaxID=65515 RepID=UPI0036244395
MSEQWHEVGDRVFVRRHESYDLNVGLVVGDGHCLVLDTRETARRASDLVAAIRRITPDPWTVVNSHAHFDHYFGNAMFVPAEIWAHARAAEEIEKDGEAVRDRVAAGREPEAADVEIVAPTTPSPTGRPSTSAAGPCTCATSAGGTPTTTSSCTSPTLE